MPKKERIEVTKIEPAAFSDHGNWYNFHIATSPGKPWATIAKDKFPAIKAAIERVLNDEGVVSYSFGLVDTRTDPPTRYYTEASLKTAEETAFSAARKATDWDGSLILVSDVFAGFVKGGHIKFPTFQDYLNSKNK